MGYIDKYSVKWKGNHLIIDGKYIGQLKINEQCNCLYYWQSDNYTEINQRMKGFTADSIEIAKKKVIEELQYAHYPFCKYLLCGKEVDNKRIYYFIKASEASKYDRYDGYIDWFDAIDITEAENIFKRKMSEWGHLNS